MLKCLQLLQCVAYNNCMQQTVAHETTSLLYDVYARQIKPATDPSAVWPGALCIL